MLVVSPHLDDAVFGCGQWLATAPGAVIVTVFAGAPGRYGPPTPWDAAAGFRAGDDVVGVRRVEDAMALRRLGARPVWLGFRDAQYGMTPALDELTAALADVIGTIDTPTVVVPLGLFHSDHALVHEAALGLLSRFPDHAWVAWEEPMYRRIHELRDRRLASLDASGIRSELVVDAPAGDLERKRDAVLCYRSQLRALTAPGHPGYADVFAPERFWRLRRPWRNRSS